MKKKLEFNSPIMKIIIVTEHHQNIYDDYNLKVIDEQQELYNNDSDNENQQCLPIHQNLTEKVIIKEQQLKILIINFK